MVKLDEASSVMCSFELCKLLKNSDIAIRCDYWYLPLEDGTVEFHRFDREGVLSNDKALYDYVYPCPNIFDLFVWFIKNRKVTLSVNMGIYKMDVDEQSRLYWDFFIVEIGEDGLKYPTDTFFGYNTCEEAFDEGLKFLMRNYV